MKKQKKNIFASLLASVFAFCFLYGKEIIVGISVVLIAIGAFLPEIRFGVGVTLVCLVLAYIILIYLNKSLLRSSLKYVIQGMMEIIQTVVEQVEELKDSDFDIDHTDSLLIREKILRDRILEMSEDLIIRSKKIEVEEYTPALDEITKVIVKEYYPVVSTMDEHIVESCRKFHDAYAKLDYEITEGFLHRLI